MNDREILLSEIAAFCKRGDSSAKQLLRLIRELVAVDPNSIITIIDQDDSEFVHIAFGGSAQGGSLVRRKVSQVRIERNGVDRTRYTGAVMPKLRDELQRAVGYMHTEQKALKVTLPAVSSLRRPSLNDRSAFYAILATHAHIESHYADDADRPTTRDQIRNLLAVIIDQFDRAELHIGEDWVLPKKGKDLTTSAKRYEAWIDAGNPDIA